MLNYSNLFLKYSLCSIFLQIWPGLVISWIDLNQLNIEAANQQNQKNQKNQRKFNSIELMKGFGAYT